MTRSERGLRTTIGLLLRHVARVLRGGGMTSCETLCGELHLSKYLMRHSLYRLTFRAQYKLQSNPQKPAHSLQLLVWTPPQWYTHLGTNSAYQSELTDDRRKFQNIVLSTQCHKASLSCVSEEWHNLYSLVTQQDSLHSGKKSSILTKSYTERSGVSNISVNVMWEMWNYLQGSIRFHFNSDSTSFRTFETRYALLMWVSRKTVNSQCNVQDIGMMYWLPETTSKVQCSLMQKILCFWIMRML